MVKRLAVVLLPIALVALAVVPLAIDQPFGTQTASILAAAFLMRRWSPLLSIAGVAVLVALTVTGWRQWRGPFARLGLVAALAATIAATWFAYQNPFEWMFNPLPQPQYAAAQQAAFVEPGDLVLSVCVKGDAAAYPIRQLAYHHVVNDIVGGVPAVVTY